MARKNRNNPDLMIREAQQLLKEMFEMNVEYYKKINDRLTEADRDVCCRKDDLEHMLDMWSREEIE